MRIIIIGSLFWFLTCACGETAAENGNQGVFPQKENLAVRNLTRAMELADRAFTAHFTGSGMTMARYYNPYTNTRSNEVGSIWMYTSAIEAVNAILHALQTEKEQGDGSLYNEHFDRYAEQLGELYENADYYLGTFTLTSYTQTKEWTVYGVNRGASKGGAQVDGVENVYDDQMWLIRELLESYKLTGEERYLEKAEYLTGYVLDGWDCTLDTHGNEIGGIPWGPGYVTKHSCSNGPIVSPLVWLHELYKGKNDEVTHRYIDPEDRKTRRTVQRKKSEYYLTFAGKIYGWQKQYLLRADGVYDDMMGGCTPGSPELETINGVAYRKGITCRDRVGPAITYNSGTMLSGAADLYRATGNGKYLTDGSELSDASFSYFAKRDANVEGYYTYNINGFNNWFNGVLMRGYVDFCLSYPKVENYIDSFQKNLDYAYDHFFYNGFLPTNLLAGWNQNNNNNNTEGMFNFAFAAEYAVLSRYELTK
ncbi:glycoside hydrolase family 76 protein [uncultured Proteiniphilum sp.]|uniref:glycoside hydrolase family 76 protein n=1 Tax=uncultured Proteiniphilum sp. TaxID=497637 RepID=UPI00261AE133|nr:glycoside hydrolase family 76 protein [uncultured Proteiniphilum sp.]